MPLYEHVYIARQDVSQQQVETLTENLKSIIQAGGGEVTKNEYWGLRSLAYRIKKNRKGHYALMNIAAPHEAVAEMERQMSLNEDVLRFQTIRVDELEEGESVAIRFRNSRDDRRGRGDRDDRGPRGDRGRDRDDRGPRGDRAPREDKPADKPKAQEGAE